MQAVVDSTQPVYVSLPHGGWCPKGRRSEDGTIPDKYQLQETVARDYIACTGANALEADATVIFTQGPLTGGSLVTIKYVRRAKRPLQHIDLQSIGRSHAVEVIAEWLKGDGNTDYGDYLATPPQDCSLNVAGIEVKPEEISEKTGYTLSQSPDR